MKPFRRKLKNLRIKIKRWMIRFISIFPLTSKHIGSPKGFYTYSREYYDLFNSEFLNVLDYKAHMLSSISRRNIPISIHKKIHRNFTDKYIHENPETFLLTVPNGRVVTNKGTIITHNDMLLLDVSLQFGIEGIAKKAKSHQIFNYLKLPFFQKTDQKIAVMATAGGGNFFHWLTDALPRFEIIRKTSGLESIDKYVVNKGIPIIDETLTMLGIPSDKLIYADKNLHIQAKNLVVPSLPGLTGNPPAWVIAFLRENFLNGLASVSKVPKLYISRSKAKRRKVINEDDLLKYLEKFGFTPVWLEDHNLSTQISLFSSAEHIVAPHGAGLTNLIWCNPNAKVLEIFSPSYVNVCFWAIANQVKLEYHYIIGNRKNSECINPTLDNINVPIEDFRRSLDRFLF
ncbi:Protein of unknown function [Desulfonatronum thiosulfatophilum]|uniref:Glycosyltransferase 61 catalytic domain-containing protein n=2 Tax=Desulfonatronum thiosulfatophilum TaxID=617002 RepID=A0A1G6BD97_9BACT|nr:Protein of unknown function [Desulfonatronum thiosulfatophilum]